MINRTKGIMVFIIFITVLTFGTGVKSRNSQNETPPENPGIIKPKNKSGKYEDNETNSDKKKKHSLKNKKNIISKSTGQNGTEIGSGIGIENLKEEIIFKLVKKFSGKFFVGSENIFLKKDVKKMLK